MTIRSISGARVSRDFAIVPSDHSAPGQSLTICPSSSCMPSGEPPYCASMPSRNPSARLCAFSAVRSVWVTTPLDALSSMSCVVGRGVVVTMSCGVSPVCVSSRKARRRFDKVSSAWFHEQNSSAHAASNCEPRSPSGASAEKICAVAPLGHSRRRREAIYFGRSLGCPIWSKPD